MNNDLKISMKLVSSDNIEMKLEDSKPIDVNMNGGIVEIDPIFTDSPAYTITYNDIAYWNNKSNFSGSYTDLTNKPFIPTQISDLNNDLGYITKNVNNLTNYTLTSNLASVATSGDYSDLSNTPTIPTSTSDLDNDSGFITNTVDNLTNYTLSTDLSTVATTGDYNDLINTPTLATVATSGLYQDLINKPTLSTVASTGDYDDLTNKPTIPTKTSELTNDSGFITNANIPTKTSDLINDSGFITNANIPTKTSDLINDSGFITNANIPTKTSDLTNDSGFITNAVNDLTNYTLTSNLSSVATSGSYADLSNTPTIPIVDTSVNASSTNAIENGAITSYVNTKGIYESGSNSNGYYIKYDDGTMICNNRVSQTKNISSSYEGVYYSSTSSISFPQTFVSIPCLIVTLEQSGSLLTFNISGNHVNYFDGYVWKSQSKSNVTFNINYIAIGRWK